MWPPLGHVPASVGGDQGAVDQGGLVGAEPDDQLGDLGGLDEPADGVRPLDLLPDLRRGDRLRPLVIPVRTLPGAIALTRMLRFT
jgi:hypothetical protein